MQVKDNSSSNRNVIDLFEYRERRGLRPARHHQTSDGQPRVRTDRFVLGTLCNYLDVDGDPDCIRDIVVTIVGTWAIVEGARQRRFGQDPQTDETAHGYILLPSNGGPFILVTFGAVQLGELKSLF